VKGHADVAAVDVRGHGQDLVMPYPKPVSPLFASIFYSVFAALGVAFVALAFKGWEMGIYGPAVFLLILGGFVAPVFMLYMVRHVAAWGRSARGAWWLRLSTTGFEVNERLFGPPRRYKWCEIDSFILTGASPAEERVGFRYSRECHRFRHRRGAKPDGFVMGHWDRDPDQAVDLMTEWLTRYKAA
jgi:hypothetical protein